VSAATGWDFSWKESAEVGERSLVLQRAFNMKHGYTRDHDSASPRMMQAQGDGPGKGMGCTAEDWEKTVDIYYEAMGWDKQGKPLPATLERLGLDFAIKDMGVIAPGA
jgi:aldehyde:ferredoxin oxidoreductase